MPLFIGNKQLVPSPFVNIQKQITFASDGSPLNASYSISLEGTILPQKGSPTSSGWFLSSDGEPTDELISTDDSKFNSILSKQELLRDALSATGWKLSYTSPGLDPVECYPKLTSLNFSQGSWVILCPYSATLEAPVLNKVNTNNDLLDYPSGYYGLNLTNVSDDYSIRESEDGRKIVEIGRNLSATSAFLSGPSGIIPPWENARTWVQRRKNDVPFGSGFITVSNLSSSGYNFIEEENINQLGGQYSLSQRFTYNQTNYIETRTVSRSFERNKLGNGGADITRISVNGNITGLHPTNDPSGKFQAASGYFTSLLPTLPVLVGAVGRTVSENININPVLGTIDYDLQYVNNSGIYYSHTYDVSYQLGSDLPTVSINGNIEGYTPDDNYYGNGNGYTKFNNAVSGWNAVSGMIRSLAFSYSASGLTGQPNYFTTTPLTKNVTFNQANGTVGYNYVYIYSSGGAADYQHSYTVELSTDNAIGSAYGGLLATAVINGQIQGLSEYEDSVFKLANAKKGWGVIKNQLYTLANAEYSLLGTNMANLSDIVTRKTITSDHRAGNIGYSVSFSNASPTSSGNVAIEDVTVEDVLPNSIFAIQTIPGRIQGPIFQNIGTVSENRRNINISLTMYPQTAKAHYYDYSDRTIPALIASGIASGFIPSGSLGTDYFIVGNSESWNYKAGLFTKTLSITY